MVMFIEISSIKSWGYYDIHRNIPYGKQTIDMERSTNLDRKIQYFDWASFNSKLLNYQRVPFGKSKSVLENLMF